MPEPTAILDARVRLPVDLRKTDGRPAALARQQYDDVLDMSAKVAAGTTEALLQQLRGNDIDHAVVHAETEGAEDVGELNAATAGLVAEHPDLLSGFGTVTMPPPTAGSGAREVQACADAGLIGVNIQPAFFGMDTADRRLYPAYARAEELGMVVALHTGVNYSRVYPMAHERPAFLDQVACDFPDLRLIACHGGWPWVAEFCAIARRHPTVYLELGGLAPRYVTRPGTGWDVLGSLVDNLLRGQVLFATDWPIFDHARALREWRAAGLREETLRAVLGGNALDLLGGPGLRRRDGIAAPA
jgi:predicted TIM-barrel fold metal-dependent hydrolase